MAVAEQSTGKSAATQAFQKVREEELQSIRGECAARDAAAGMTGLALSGGGIRSATFALGVLQALASARKLASFDYLSTVSGGGYIGSWLSAWIRRTNLKVVQEQLGQSGPLDNGNLQSAEPREVSWLRRYSNYLAPRVGLLSTDSLTLMSVWTRNVFLNLVVIVSFIIAVILLPQALLRVVESLQDLGPALAETAKYFGLLVVPLAIMGNLQHAQRCADDRNLWLLSPRGVAVTVVMPSIIAAIAGSIWLFGTPSGSEFQAERFAVAAAILAAFGGAIWLGINLRQRSDWKVVIREAGVFVLAATGGVATAMGILWAACKVLGSTSGIGRTAALLTLGPPAFLLAFGVGGSVFVGLVGRAYYERSREWWGRLNAWFLTLGTAWLVIVAVSFYVPPLIDWFAKTLPSWITALSGLGWLGSLLATLATPARTGLSKAAQNNLMTVLNIAAFLFIAGFVMLTSYGTASLLSTFGVQNAAPPLHSGSLPEFIGAYMGNLTQLDCLKVLGVPFLWLALLVDLAVFGLFGWRVDVNKFSLHNMYKNRLIRCYLGASNPQPNAQPFTGFDEGDDLPLHELVREVDGQKRMQRPIHIINTTLNLAQGKNLAWQERKGASFVLTPKYSGFALSEVQGERRNGAGDHNNAYRDTAKYASMGDEDEGFSLGMAMATSGAAASPNMGSATRTAIAFVMTLFNARLGRWSPNPARPRWERASPRFGIWCLFAELFGMSNERSSFVYLSDGGHFDNMGIYELVRRGCTTIWLVDAAADAARTFEDLGRAIRQCRVDFGVEIAIDLGALRSRNALGEAVSAFTCGTIDYGAGHPAGKLVYIKPSLCVQQREPEDLRAYAAHNPTFPQQSTLNQFYDESEFESYRRLGLEIGAQCLARYGSQLPVVSPPDRNIRLRGERALHKPNPLGFWLIVLAAATVASFLALAWFQSHYLTCLTPATSALHLPAADAGWLTRQYNSILLRDEQVLSCPQTDPLASALSGHDLLGMPLPMLTLARAWLWADSLFIPLYTGVFVIAYICLARRPGRRLSSWVLQVLLAVAIAGALFDFVENFLLLGGPGPGTGDLSRLVVQVGPASAGKFICAIANILCILALSLWPRAGKAKVTEGSSQT